MIGGGTPTASAAVATARQASDCAELATGPVTDAFKSAVCTELVADLQGIGGLLGLPALLPTASALSSPVKVVFSPTPDPKNGDDTYMETTYFSPIGGTVGIEPCEITIFPSAYDGETPVGSGVSSKIRVLLAHEVVHCYQNSVISYQESGGTTKVPQWMSEGLATYVATLYVDYGEPATPTFWGNWFGTPNKELIARSYDAVGWYSLVAHVTGNDLTSKIVPAWRAWVDGGENEFISALGGDDPSVFKAWAPSLLHQPDWGDAWNTPGVAVPASSQPTEIQDTLASEDVPYSVKIAPLGAIVDNESTVADGLVEISVDSGYASVHDAANDEYLDFTDQLFCLKDACPDAAVTCPGVPTPVAPLPITAPFVVAVGGSTAESTFTIENISAPSTPSTPKTLPTSAGPCKFGAPEPLPPAGFSEGEPHIQTLNGGSYDFQGAGEYTLVRSASGDVDVQVRAAPFEDSKSVAFNTAVAANVVSTVVEVDAGDPAVVRVNGKRITAPIHGSLALGHGTEGGHLTYSTVSGGITDVVATWPDGSELDISANGTLGENATFVPPATPVDTFSGLLAALVLPHGKAKGTTASSSVTLLGGDGHNYDINPATAAGFKALYGPFAASWRVTPKTSLFTYENGTTTKSFDIKGFPARLVTASLLTPAERKKGKAACKAAGITGAVLLNDCIIDVGETGKRSLATATARVQSQVSSSTTTTAPPGSTTTTTTTTAPAAGGHPASYYFTHSCSAVTKGELQQAVGSVSAVTGGDGAACTFRPNSSAVVDSMTFSHDSVGLFEGTHRGQSGSGPVASLGHGAYCIVSPPFVTDQSYVVVSLGAAGSLQVLAGNCTEGTALVKDALARITGL
jgi:hypothetical protein